MEEEEIDWIVNNVSCLNNSGNSTEEIDSFYFYEAEQFTVLGILLVIIIIGNGAVLKTLLCTKSRKSRMNFFICHLAFSDLSVGLICVLTDIIWRLTVSWNAGNIACKIIKFLQVSVTYASSYVLVALSIDRYDAIRHPMKFSGSWKRAKCLIIAAWMLSILFAIPILILYEEKSIKGTLQCWLDFEQPWHWQVYMVLVSMSVFILPAVIITGCYAVIIATIWSKSAIIAVTKNNAKCYLGCDNTRRVSSRGLIPRAKVKTVKITLVIVSVFIMCWSPYILFGLFQVFDLVPHQNQTLIAVATFIQSLAFLNSAANPIIYCIFSTHLCRLLTLIPPIKWFFSCKRKIRDDSQTTTSNTQTSSLSEYLTNNTRKSKSFVKTSTLLSSPNRNVVSFYVD